MFIHRPRNTNIKLCGSEKSSRIPTVLQTISTPLKVEEWERALVGHPDEDLVGYVLSGIRGGFRVGFDYSKYTCVGATGGRTEGWRRPLANWGNTPC